MEINQNTKIGEGDPSLSLRDDTESLWYRGKEVAIRKLLFPILNFHRIATSFPFNHIKYCHSEPKPRAKRKGKRGISQSIILKLLSITDTQFTYQYQ